MYYRLINGSLLFIIFNLFKKKKKKRKVRRNILQEIVEGCSPYTQEVYKR